MIGAARSDFDRFWCGIETAVGEYLGTRRTMTTERAIGAARAMVVRESGEGASR
jgi:hypothetical protein